MNKFSNDSSILSLQQELMAAKARTVKACEEDASESEIVFLMEYEDAIINELLSRGCHMRDCC